MIVEILFWIQFRSLEPFRNVRIGEFRHSTVETNPIRNHAATGSIPGPTQWVKDLVLPWAVVWVADTARIWHCCGSGVSQWPQVQLDPEPPYALGVALKRQKDQKKEMWGLLLNDTWKTKASLFSIFLILQKQTRVLIPDKKCALLFNYFKL